MTAYQHIIFALLILSDAAHAAAADRGRMVEITCDGRKRTGTVVLHNGTTGWFLERDGRLDPIALGEVSEFRELGRFQPWNIIEYREKLGRELGPKFVVSSSAHYLVAAPPGVGDRFARLFEDLYRQLVVVFTARGFRIHEPEFPLVAVVLPDQAAFVQYCVKEKVRPLPGLRGYYLPSTNRVALYDTSRNGLGGASDVDDTVIHEATHQVAFNLGVHSRMNADPKWVVEGLATVFEQGSARLNDRRANVLTRVNPERYAWFQRYRQSSRAPGSLAKLVQSEEFFKASPLDGYAEAWALTFYLLESRPSEYASYLQKLARRNPWEEYEAESRLKDFQAAFGRDLSALEVQHLRFYQELAVGETAAN